MKAEKKVIPIDAYEEGAVIKGLNKIRTEQLARGETADFVSDLILKIIHARPKRVREKEAQPRGADDAARSLRRRDEAR